MEVVLGSAFPKAQLTQNDKTKPRKGSFEVTLSHNGSTKVIYSKLDSFGPQKSREALPDPVRFITKTLPPLLGSKVEKKAKEEESEKDSESEISLEESEKEEEKKPEVKKKAKSAALDVDNLDKLTVVKLKEQLKKRKLSVVGLKAELVERLKEALENEN